MGLSVQVPKDKQKLEQAISALEWQLQQDEDDASRKIHRQTLDIFRAALREMESIPKNGFTAEKTNFCGKPGYMVSQYHNGKEVVKQFIPETSYKAFCKAINTEPVIITEE